MGSESPSRNDDGIDPSQSEDVNFAPITSPIADGERGAPLQKQRSSASRSVASGQLERSWSLNDGVSVGRHDVDEAEVAIDNAAYSVGWEENDPLNPRNMNTARRWLIVCIVSLGSLCV